ncbi:MAG: recombination mediator RecR [Candidatus Nealsonbacteria bacterium]
MFSPAIEKLINIFSKFPTVGPRTANRFVFHLLKKQKEEIEELIAAIENLKEKIKFCDLCFLPFEGEGGLCYICQNNARDKSLLCIVEKESDLASIEKTKKYKGLYFILGGTISPLKKKEKRQIREKGLQDRTKDKELKEIIIAVNPNSEGEATALYLERLLKPLNKKTTRLARGLPVGAELEYADEETLSSALEGRK